MSVYLDVFGQAVASLATGASPRAAEDCFYFPLRFEPHRGTDADGRCAADGRRRRAAGGYRSPAALLPAFFTTVPLTKVQRCCLKTVLWPLTVPVRRLRTSGKGR